MCRGGNSGFSGGLCLQHAAGKDISLLLLMRCPTGAMVCVCSGGRFLPPDWACFSTGPFMVTVKEGGGCHITVGQG